MQNYVPFKIAFPPKVFFETCVGLTHPTEISSSNSPLEVSDGSIDEKFDGNSVGHNPTENPTIISVFLVVAAGVETSDGEQERPTGSIALRQESTTFAPVRA
ncbi:hypothetical protein PIB30_097271 [Stylosanthes scabra]|uniref:Uncharacterized protein n=1 Tax=Stylosanthes scabra TaxID=79078 RepID=A0ABU6UV42_9FABA|nr:hypothetical protein [Stylosanthes scabra]